MVVMVVVVGRGGGEGCKVMTADKDRQNSTNFIKETKIPQTLIIL